MKRSRADKEDTILGKWKMKQGDGKKRTSLIGIKGLQGV